MSKHTCTNTATTVDGCLACEKARPMGLPAGVRAMSDVGPFWAGERAGEATAPVDDLGAAADQLNDALDQAEALFEKRFRAPAEVHLNPGGSLQWRKAAGWGLCVEDAGAPLRKCSLAIRQAASHKLDDLWMECERAEEASSAATVEARQAVLAFLEKRGSKGA